MKVSLITACYNSAGTIRTAIESVLAQRGVDVEYIIVDGCSTDGTVEQIENVKWKMTAVVLHFNSSVNVTGECTTPSTRASRWRLGMW